MPRHVAVLVPTMPTADDHLQYYGDFEPSRNELARAFQRLGITWEWVPVAIDNAAATIDRIVRHAPTAKELVFLNLCDGDELNGVAGVSVIDALDDARQRYTGADAAFYRITTSKIDMKRAFDAAGVPTPRWSIVTPADRDWTRPFRSSDRPLIVKPAVSAGSLGIGIDNVVHTPTALATRVAALAAGYRGWDLAAGGFIAEQFIAGREFTVLIVGDGRPGARVRSHAPRRVFPPVERVFASTLPDTERFLSFDRLWEFYDGEAPLDNAASLWEYGAVPDAALAARIASLAWDAYGSVGGSGYGRVDIRQDASTGELYVLEVNAQCGLSEDENYTSIGAILRFADTGFDTLIDDILVAATPLKRRARTASTARRFS
jgi:D-alanine-D-alanine ligase